MDASIIVPVLLAVFGLIFGLMMLLYNKIEGVREYASTRFHDLSNTTQVNIGAIDDDLVKLIERVVRLERNGHTK